jgi:putative SOS response-associated peptidase YedK
MGLQLRWGLIPYWCDDPKGGRKPINAKCESVRELPTFREAYRKRRCIVPVDGFFEWKAIKGLFCLRRDWQLSLRGIVRN